MSLNVEVRWGVATSRIITLTIVIPICFSCGIFLSDDALQGQDSAEARLQS